MKGLEFEGVESSESFSELESLKEKLTDFQIENARLKKVIVENDLEDELEDINMISTEEQLCINGINFIADQVKNHNFTDKDIKSFDTLLKALKLIRGEQVPKESRFNKKASTANLMSIVNGSK